MRKLGVREIKQITWVELLLNGKKKSKRGLKPRSDWLQSTSLPSIWHCWQKQKQKPHKYIEHVFSMGLVSSLEGKKKSHFFMYKVQMCIQYINRFILHL